jgi:hypothetical protein
MTLTTRRMILELFLNLSREDGEKRPADLGGRESGRA